MGSNSLKLENDNVINFSGDFPVEIGDSWFRYLNSDGFFSDLKEQILGIFNSESFFESELLLSGKYSFYVAILALEKGAKSVDIIENNNSEIFEIQNSLNQLNLNINLIHEIDKESEYDVIISDNNDLIKDYNECIKVFIADEIIITYPSEEIKSEFINSSYPLTLQDIFISLTENQYEYLILRNHEIITDSLDEYDDMQIDIYFSKEAFDYFEERVGKYYEEQKAGSQLIKINIGDEENPLDLKFNLIEENEFINLSENKKIINKGLITLDDKNKISYLFKYATEKLGGINYNYFSKIEFLISKDYNDQYEWRVNNYNDIKLYCNKYLNLGLESDNYQYRIDSLIHNYIFDDAFFRVYYQDDVEIRELTPTLASKDIFILEKHDINTEIISENDDKIIYKINSDKHQIIKNPFHYLDQLNSDNWMSLEAEGTDSFAITPQSDIVIIGMHRSGTSMVASIVESIGGHLGTHILGKNDSNSNGHFEDQELIELNDKILTSIGYAWDKPPKTAKVLNIRSELQDEINSLIKKKRKNIFWGWKDPRTCLTFNLFDQYLKNKKIIIVERDKEKVVKSLKNRNGISYEKASNIYDVYIDHLNLIKEQEECFVINYNYFINESNTEINKLIDFLNISFPKNKYQDLKSFIKPRGNLSNESNPISLLNEINEAIISNKFNEALNLIEKIISESTSQINNIEYLRAFCLLQLGKYQQAYEAARNEIILNPRNENALDLIEKISSQHPDIDKNIDTTVDVTIALPVFNNSSLTKACVESLYRYTKNINFEVLVIDNGSTDNTQDILKELKIYHNLKTINNLDNIGFAKAVNQAIKSREGKHLLILNNDTKVTEGWIQPLIHSINSGVGIAGACLLYPGTDIIQHKGVEIGTEDGKTIAPFHPNQYSSLQDVPENKNMYLSAVTGAAMLINSKLLEECNGFDDNFVNGLEDIDFCFEAKTRNYKIEYCSDSIIYHFESMSEGRHNNDIENWKLLNSKWLGKIEFDLTQKETINKIKLIEHEKEKNKEIINKSLEYELNNLFDIKEDLIKNNNKPDFSIIIPVHNNLEFTKSCINNILKTSALFSIEIIIIENNSDDETKSYLKSYADDRIKVIFNTQNESFSKSNNQGAKIASADNLIFMNNDVDVLPGWLEAIEETFAKDSTIGIQGAKLLYPNHTIQHAGLVWGPVSKDLNLHFHIYLAHADSVDHVNISREYQMLTGALFAVRKTVFEEVKGFDEEYYFGHEDLDLCMKIKEANYKVWYNHNIIAIHHESITKKSEGIENFERFINNPNSYDAKNHQRFLNKWQNKLVIDSIKYYQEDHMYGLIGDIELYNKFEEQLKLLFSKLKNIPQNSYQEHANKVSEILFGRPNIDFVANSKILLNCSFKDLVKSIEYLESQEIEIELDSENKKILFTMFGWNQSGGGTILPREMAKSLVKRGFDVTVFYAGLNHPENTTPYFVENTIEDGVQLVGIFNRDFTLENNEDPLLDIHNIPIVETFEKLLDDFNPDIVHFQNFVGLSFNLAEITKNRNIYSIYIPYNYHLIDPKLYMINNDLKKWNNTDFFANSEIMKEKPDLKDKFIERKNAALNVFKNVDHVQAVSSRVKDIFVEFGASPDNIIVINQIPSSTKNLNTVKSNNLSNPIKFGFIGGIMPHKGVHNLIAASTALPDKSCEILLYGFVSPQYRALIKGIETKIPVKFMGEFHSDDLPDIAGTFDIAVLPSIWEDCGPHVISECLALNLPIIAPNIGGFSDYVKTDYNGFIYQYDDVEQLAQIMFGIINKPNKLKNLKQNAQLSYSYSDYIDHIVQIYLERPTKEAIFNYELKFLDKVNIINHKHELPANRDIAGVTSGFSNTEATGKMPNPLPQIVKLNLGCGKDIREDFINIDLFSDNERVVYGDIRKLDLNDNVADYILASDVLEHFSHRETDQILSEWHRVLKPNGTIDLRLPNLRLQIEAYNRGDWNADVASYMIFGGQTNPGDYHCIGFDEKTIAAHLDKAGFILESIENQDFPQNQGFINLNMIVKAKKRKNAVDEFNDVMNFSNKNGSKVLDDNDINKELNIVWEGSQFVNHSLAKVNREISYNLIKSGSAQLTIVPFEQDEFSPNGDPKLVLLSSHDIKNIEEPKPELSKLPYVWVRHQWPPKDEVPIGSKWIIMQPWEYTSLRKEDVPIFQQAFEIWTPSNWSRNIFIKSGLDYNKVQVIPNGVDPVIYSPVGKKYHLKTNKKLKLLFVGGTLPRKGIDILLDCYIDTFNPNDDICLVVKGMGSGSFYKGQSADDMINNTKNDPNMPEIEFIKDELSEDEMASLYRSCEVLVIPYRAEGFCMPVLEAMACGLAVVVTDGGATDDYVDELVGWKIPSEYKEMGNQTKLGETVEKAGWLVPNTDILKYILEDIYKNPSKIFALGLQGQYRARKHFTWRNSTIKILKRLDFLQETEMAKSALKNLPEHSDDLILLGSAEESFNHGRVKKAKELFDEVTKTNLDPFYKSYAYNALAIINLDTNRLQEAFDNINNALKTLENPDSKFLLAKYYFKNSDYEDALNTSNPLAENWINTKWDSKLGMTLDGIITFMAEICFEMEDLEAALKLCQTAISHNPSNIDTNLLLGIIMKEDGQLTKAEEFFNLVLNLDPENQDAKIELESMMESN